MGRFERSRYHFLLQRLFLSRGLTACFFAKKNLVALAVRISLLKRSILSLWGLITWSHPYLESWTSITCLVSDGVRFWGFGDPS